MKRVKRKLPGKWKEEAALLSKVWLGKQGGVGERGGAGDRASGVTGVEVDGNDGGLGRFGEAGNSSSLELSTI